MRILLGNGLQVPFRPNCSFALLRTFFKSPFCALFLKVQRKIDLFICFFINTQMSKPSWASIVQKQSMGTDSSYSAQPMLPMNVIVPEPPMPLSLCDGHNQAENNNPKSFASLLEDIIQQKQLIQKEVEQKDEKFKKSYAYTRFSQEMDALEAAKKALEEKELDVKRAIILAESIYSKKVLEVIMRIKSYLGEDYHYRYSGYNGYKSMYYSCCLGPLYDFNSENGEGLKVSIVDGLSVDYEFPNKIKLDFEVESSDMLPVLEAAIQEHLKGFSKTD